MDEVVDKAFLDRENGRYFNMWLIKRKSQRRISWPTFEEPNSPIAIDKYSKERQFSMIARKNMIIPRDYVRFTEKSGMAGGKVSVPFPYTLSRP